MAVIGPAASEAFTCQIIGIDKRTYFSTPADGFLS